MDCLAMKVYDEDIFCVAHANVLDMQQMECDNKGHMNIKEIHSAGGTFRLFDEQTGLKCDCTLEDLRRMMHIDEDDHSVFITACFYLGREKNHNRIIYHQVVAAKCRASGRIG